MLKRNNIRPIFQEEMKSIRKNTYVGKCEIPLLLYINSIYLMTM